MSRKTVGCLMVVMAWVLGASAPLAAKVAGLSATVEFQSSMIARSERPVVTLTIANDSSADVYLVRWQTPFQGIQSNLFDVRRNGQPVAYTGLLAKRMPPTASDYILVSAGA